jgi:hypothetical protein
MLGIAGHFPFERGSRSAGQFRCRASMTARIVLPDRTPFELVVALAPVQLDEISVLMSVLMVKFRAVKRPPPPRG